MRIFKSLMYGIHQALGKKRQRWIEDPTAPGCPTMPSKLAWQDLIGFQNDPTEPDPEPVLYDALEDHLDEVQIQELDEGWWARICIEQLGSEVDPTSGKKPKLNIWKGQVAPGILMIEEIKRTSGPYCSEISAAAYATMYQIYTLKSISFSMFRMRILVILCRNIFILRKMTWSGTMRRGASGIQEAQSSKRC